MNYSELLGTVRARYNTIVYDDYDDVAGQKSFYEALGAIKPATDARAKTVINSFLRLYRDASIDNSKTTVTVKLNLDSLFDWEDDITGAENVEWKITTESVDQLGNEYTKNLGAIKGNLTQEKQHLFDRMIRDLLDLTYNNYKNTDLSGVSYPYKE